jgi:hypothetical protein
MAVHERVDIERWKAQFPLDRLRQEAREFVRKRREERPDLYADEAAVERHVALMEPKGDTITSPHDIAVVEQLRGELIPTVPETERVPTDVFVFGKGEAPRPDTTKVGGLPFLPAARAWPRTPEGKPMTFVAQFNFADSHDIVGHLPGDVLLIFGDEDGIYSLDGAGMVFEWVLGSEDDIISASNVPATEWTISPCFGAIHRTWDYPGDPHVLAGFGAWQDVALILGTKIAGAPWWIQEEEPPPGRFLCTLGSVQPAFLQPFPYLNVPEAINDTLDPDRNNLMWGDMGTVYIFVDDDGNVDWTWQCF